MGFLHFCYFLVGVIFIAYGVWAIKNKSMEGRTFFSRTSYTLSPSDDPGRFWMQVVITLIIGSGIIFVSLWPPATAVIDNIMLYSRLYPS